MEWYLWLLLFVFLFVVEMCTINLVSIWFAIGALASAITTIFTDNGLIQLLVFAVVSTVALIVTKPVVNKIRKRKTIPTNLDSVIGKTGIAISSIEPLSTGLVKAHGSTWTAVSDESIEDGDRVEILRIEGVKLVVKKKEDK